MKPRTNFPTRSHTKSLISVLVLLMVSVIASGAAASTFVGNGGNVGDVELQMTLQQLNQTFSEISTNQEGLGPSLCKCSPTYEGRPQCDVLKRLTEPQVKFCARFIQLKAKEMQTVLNEKERVQFTWTHQPIEVREQGHLRAVDAVTNIKDMSMTLNQEAFLNMSVDERAFLVGHELFHLTTYQGQPLSDEGAAGPFTGADGSRQFINAMAASLVMLANDTGAFRQTESTLKRSKASTPYWVSLAWSSLTPGYNHDNAFAVERVEGAELSGRYQFNTHWAAVAAYRNLLGTRSRLTQIEGKESREVLGVGVAYRWFPSENPLTFWGQSHAVFSATADRVSVKYDLRSVRTGLTDSASTTGFTVNAQYYVPFRHGFWGFASLGYSQQNFKLPELLAEYTGGVSTAVGVSYGF